MDNVEIEEKTASREANSDRQATPRRRGFAGRVLAAVGITATVALLLLLLWYAVDVLLLAFAGILLAIFLRALSVWLSGRTPLSGGWSLAVVILALVSVLGAGAWLLAPDVAEQVDQLSESVPRSAQQLGQRIERYAWGRQLLAQVPTTGELLSDKSNVLARVTGVFSTTFGLIAGVVIVLFVGLYLAADPQLYAGGLVRLVPANKRGRAREVLSEVGQTLRWWLLGQIVAMTIVGALSALGLWLLGVPLALTLGLLAALLTFIPNIGPVIAVVPAALLALTQSPTRALYVLLLYLAIQTVESYLITPLMQQRTVRLPPALTIIAQVILGVMLGALGLLLATPLTAAALVLVKKLYVEDTLGDPVSTQE